MKIFLSFMVIILFGCSSAKQKSIQQEITFEVLLEGTHGGYKDAEFMVIDNSKDLKQIYTHLNKIRKPGFPIPKINFEKELVLALFMGEKSSGGYTILISEIEEVKDKVHVFIKKTKPEGMAATVITRPFYFCKIPKTDKEIVFKNVD